MKFYEKAHEQAYAEAAVKYHVKYETGNLAAVLYILTSNYRLRELMKKVFKCDSDNFGLSMDYDVPYINKCDIILLSVAYNLFYYGKVHSYAEKDIAHYLPYDAVIYLDPLNFNILIEALYICKDMDISTR